MPAVATAQAERTITPEDIDSYVAEFQQDPDVTPVVDGVGGISDSELAAYHEMVRATQAVGDPETELVPGQMWSDTVGLPAGVDKTDADAAEIAIAVEQDTPPSIDSLETLGTLDSMAMAPTSTYCRTFLFSPHQVCGAILARYEALGGQFGWLMHPIEPMHLNPDGQGYRQRFHNGFIYWHPTTGAHAVTTRSAVVWARNGWEQGWLGYPLGGEVPVTGTTPADGELNGWVQIFQGGRIYRTPLAHGPQVASINGLILDKWLSLGGPNSDLGFPIADEAKTPDGIGRFSIFQHGSIYWHPHHGAHPIPGEIHTVWLEDGGEMGTFGYPLCDPEKYSEKMANQRFERGEIAANLYPDPIFKIIEFLPFNTLEEARKYFENQQPILTNNKTLQRSNESSVPCETYSSNLHKRTKSDNTGVKPPKIGFKPVLNCAFSSGPTEATGYGWIYYDRLGRWDQAAYAKQSFNRSSPVVQTNIEASCSGARPNLFWGSSYFHVRHEGKNYYGRSNPEMTFLFCTIDRT
ncbi:LGFP repeat-containing protein [Corynebacterium nasicanis]|uniref:LGFP repeat-containing protein n=1 Tax=Corynebacterium nasicanis TaxID=1448267 RepID=A0ABW1QDG9_9CORY